MGISKDIFRPFEEQFNETFLNRQSPDEYKTVISRGERALRDEGVQQAVFTFEMSAVDLAGWNEYVQFALEKSEGSPFTVRMSQNETGKQRVLIFDTFQLLARSLCISESELQGKRAYIARDSGKLFAVGAMRPIRGVPGSCDIFLGASCSHLLEEEDETETEVPMVRVFKRLLLRNSETGFMPRWVRRSSIVVPDLTDPNIKYKCFISEWNATDARGRLLQRSEKVNETHQNGVVEVSIPVVQIADRREADRFLYLFNDS